MEIIEQHHLEEEEEEKESIQLHFTCEICIEPNMSSVVKFNNSNKCAHPFCTDCIAKYIHVKVEDDVAADIQCPGLNCKELLNPLSCMHLIPRQIFIKWCDNLCELALLRFDRCYCPYQGCSVLVVNECGGTVMRSECPNCKRLFCFKCKIPWHAGIKCEDSWQVGDTNDLLFLQLVTSNKWIRCPGCRHFVERIEGCSCISCRCHTLFCYGSGERIDPSHICEHCAPKFLLFISGFFILIMSVGFILLWLDRINVLSSS